MKCKEDLLNPPWFYGGAKLLQAPEGYLGFVYIITRVSDGKFYIGKKQFQAHTRKKPLKGKTRARLGWKESDWKSYWSSCEEIKAEIERDGTHNFQRVILSFWKTKTELTYNELLQQIEHDVMTNPLCLNGIINVRLRVFK